MTRLHTILCGDSGQDLVEYGLLAAFISISAIALVMAIGPLVTPLYTAVQNALAVLGF